MRKELLSTTIIRHTCLSLDWQPNVSIYKCLSCKCLIFIFEEEKEEDSDDDDDDKKETATILDGCKCQIQTNRIELVMKWVMFDVRKKIESKRTKWTPLIYLNEGKEEEEEKRLEIQVETHGPWVWISHRDCEKWTRYFLSVRKTCQ